MWNQSRFLHWPWPIWGERTLQTASPDPAQGHPGPYSLLQDHSSADTAYHVWNTEWQNNYPSTGSQHIRYVSDDRACMTGEQDQLVLTWPAWWNGSMKNEEVVMKNFNVGNQQWLGLYCSLYCHCLAYTRISEVVATRTKPFSGKSGFQECVIL